MFERKSRGNQAIIIHPETRDTPEDSLQEFIELVHSAGVDVLEIIVSKRQDPDPKFFIGSGKADEAKDAIIQHEADLVLVNHVLSPVQERNLEGHVEARVLDRTTLILDIFAQRARTHEGKLQVELAQLKHLSTRLVRGWTHLERQKGGIGLRGPGETQLETDRRLLSDRVKYLQKRLEKVSRQREQSRRSRKRSQTRQVSLVGYTNAGKSTLFNHLTQAEVMAEDRLFATLDPTARRIKLYSGVQAVLLDTVGFVRDLPHDLIAAFKATLQESREADLLLHVIDSNDPQRAEKEIQVNQVLQDIGAGDVPVLKVYNKIDLSKLVLPPQENEAGEIQRVAVSSVTGEGMDDLISAISKRILPDRIQIQLVLEPDQGKARAGLYETQAVLNEQFSDTGQWLLDIELEESRARKLVHDCPELKTQLFPDGFPEENEPWMIET